VDTWWNLVQDMFLTNLQTLFDGQKANETNSKKRLKAYREAYIELKCESPFITLEDNSGLISFEISQIYQN